MKTFYHLLSSDIPHHNHTVLAFFQNELLPQISESHHIFYVVSQQTLDFPMLNIRQFDGRAAITKAITNLAKQDPQARFVLHGQFNLWIWLAIFFGKLPACQTIWHIWGADLYEATDGWKAKWFYRFRRIVQKKLPQVWGTEGDLHYFWKMIRSRTAQDRLIYFPTKLQHLPSYQGELTRSKRDRELTLLVGNSGDRSNNHIQALSQIYQQLGKDVRLIIPMGYPKNNDVYIREIEQYAERLFPSKNLQILREKIDFADYLQILTACDLGYFNFERQQGIGTICLLIQLGVPFVLDLKNPFVLDLQANGVPFLLSDNLSVEQIERVKRELDKLDINQLAFFPKKYTRMWKQVLHLVADEK